MSPDLIPGLKVVLFATGEAESCAAAIELKQIFPDAELAVVDSTRAAQLLTSPSGEAVDWRAAITWLRQQQFNAAVIWNGPTQSPYALGYLCYLAGIPIRIGYSHEFGGQVLSHTSPPPSKTDCGHLLKLLTEIAA